MNLSKLLNRKRKQKKSHKNILSMIKDKKLSPIFSGEIVDLSPSKGNNRKTNLPKVDLDQYKITKKSPSNKSDSSEKIIIKEIKNNPSKIVEKNNVKVIGGKDTLVKEFLTNNIRSILEKNKVVPVITKSGEKILETSKVKDFIEKRQNNVLVSYEYGGSPITPRPGGSLVLAGDGAEPEKILPVSQSSTSSNKVVNQSTLSNPITNNSQMTVASNSSTNSIGESTTSNKSSVNFVNDYSPTNITPTNNNLQITQNRTSTELNNSMGAMRTSVMNSGADAQKMKTLNRRAEESRDTRSVPTNSSAGNAVDVKPTNTGGTKFNSFLNQNNMSLPVWRVRNG